MWSTMKGRWGIGVAHGCIAMMMLLGATPINAQEPPASIVIDAVDAETGMSLPSFGGLKAGQTVRFQLKARDRWGSTTRCTPNVSATGGHQVVQQADGSFLMTVGDSFGSAELLASCAENPDLVQKEFMAVSTPLGGQRSALAGGRGAPAAATGGGNTALTIGLIVGGGALAGVAIAAAVGAQDSTSSSSCPTLSQCCPGGSGGGCGAPSSCNCPSGTTDQGICNSGGCVAFIGAGNRSCTCN